MQSEMANLGGQIDTSAADSLRLVSELKGHEEDLAPRWHGSAMKPQRDPRPTTSRGLQPDFAGCGRSPAKEAAGKLRGRSEGDGGGERSLQRLLWSDSRLDMLDRSRSLA